MSPLETFSPLSIFPTKDKPGTENNSYKHLIAELSRKVEKLRHGENKALWLEHFDSLMMSCTGSMPAPVPELHDVSLYDYSRIVSAFSTALYLYHQGNGTLTREAIADNSSAKFLLINGNFQGIQNFIFGGFGDTLRYRSKIFRGRSFIVSLLSELAAHMLRDRLGLPCTSVILNAAGQFTILAPLIEKKGMGEEKEETQRVVETVKAVAAVEEEINRWLFDISFGETVIGISTIRVGTGDFTSGRFASLWEKKGIAGEMKKYDRLDLDIYGGTDRTGQYLKSFERKLSHPLCPICRTRPSVPGAGNSGYVRDAESSCNFCRDHVFMGTNLVKAPHLAVAEAGARDAAGENRLLEPIFGKYQVFFPSLEKKGAIPFDDSALLKYWAIGPDWDENPDEGVAIKSINGYVPRYREEDARDPRIPESDREEFAGLIRGGDPVMLNHIACKAGVPLEDKEKFRGLEALGVLKADVDSLGVLMACGLGGERFNLPRLATLSRQMNAYFAVYLPWFLAGRSEYRDIYTVFAGGDDLFLIGPWNRIIDLSLDLRKSFAEYVCRNPQIHFSGGITLHKPNTTVKFMAHVAEESLEKSKNGGRNRLTLFNETVTWEAAEELLGDGIRGKLRDWLERGGINRALLHRLNVLMEMAEKEKRLLESLDREKGARPGIHMKEMNCTRWRALLHYTCDRNIPDKERKKEMTAELAAWLTAYGGAMKLPVWDILYNYR